MIPTADILAWRAEHPWVSNAQVEQDLIICRGVIELFSRRVLREQLAFRGGTALRTALAEAEKKFPSAGAQLMLEFVAAAKRGVCADTGGSNHNLEET